MRTLRTATLLLLAATPLAAQGSRLSITPYAGWSGTAALLTHSFHIDDGTLDYASRERVAVDGAPTLGARLGVRLAPGWTVYLQGASARSRYTMRDSVVQRFDTGEEGAAGRRRSNHATASLATLELGRRVARAPGGGQLELTVGGGLQRFSLSPPEYSCPQYTLCPVALPEPWRKDFDLPSAVAGVAVRQPITRTLSAELRSSLVLGRFNTENVRVDMFGVYERYEAPRHVLVRSTQASFGLSWHP
jgi:hypothetical protein